MEIGKESIKANYTVYSGQNELERKLVWVFKSDIKEKLRKMPFKDDEAEKRR